MVKVKGWIVCVLLASGCRPDMVPYVERGTPPQQATATRLTTASREAYRHDEIGFRTPGQLMENWEKYGDQYHALTPRQYLTLAQQLRDRPLGPDVLQGVRKDGVIFRYDRRQGSLVAFTRDRKLRAFYKPKGGEAAFQAAIHRPLASARKGGKARP